MENDFHEERIRELEQSSLDLELRVNYLADKLEDLIDALHVYASTNQENLYQILARRGL